MNSSTSLGDSPLDKDDIIKYFANIDFSKFDFSDETQFFDFIEKIEEIDKRLKYLVELSQKELQEREISTEICELNESKKLYCEFVELFLKFIAKEKGEEKLASVFGGNHIDFSIVGGALSVRKNGDTSYSIHSFGGINTEKLKEIWNTILGTSNVVEQVREITALSAQSALNEPSEKLIEGQTNIVPCVVQDIFSMDPNKLYLWNYGFDEKGVKRFFETIGNFSTLIKMCEIGYSVDDNRNNNNDIFSSNFLRVSEGESEGGNGIRQNLFITYGITSPEIINTAKKIKANWIELLKDYRKKIMLFYINSFFNYFISNGKGSQEEKIRKIYDVFFPGTSNIPKKMKINANSIEISYMSQKKGKSIIKTKIIPFNEIEIKLEHLLKIIEKN